MSRLKQLVTEIHRRSLWQVLLIYVGGGWLVFEIVQTVTEGLGLPQWFPAFAALLLLIGLPVVVATAFVGEGEPAAAVSDPTLIPVDEARIETARRRRFLTWRNAVASFVVALAVWGVVASGWYLLADRAEMEGLEAAEETRKSIAVLPFENLSPDPENEFFTDGMHDEIIAHLSRIADLKVISRTSVMEYKGRSENLRTIAEELEVTNILEGTVRRANGTVRITTQLIDALADEHLWTEVYDRNLSDVFAVQSDVAQQVAVALRATLTPAEREVIEERPTENLEAYDLLLRGWDYVERRGNLRIAIDMFERAIELDPDFALAYAALSRVHSSIYLSAEDRTAQRLALAKEAADQALAIDPDLPDAHGALGLYYYRGHRDYDRALEEFSIAQKSYPYPLADIAWIERRRGNMERAAAILEDHVRRDPRSYGILEELGLTYVYLRRYAEAEGYCDRAIARTDAIARPLLDSQALEEDLRTLFPD
jgi:serine/threonine-protein kinase